MWWVVWVLRRRLGRVVLLVLVWVLVLVVLLAVKENEAPIAKATVTVLFVKRRTEEWVGRCNVCGGQAAVTAQRPVSRGGGCCSIGSCSSVRFDGLLDPPVMRILPGR